MIVLNGEPAELPERPTVTGALGVLGIEPDARGIAVAVDGEVVPRGSWAVFDIHDGARVEIVSATQGG